MSQDAAPVGWEDWEWDDTLFAGTAKHYVRGRPPYAAGIADSLASALGLDGSGRLLDLGCGPGTITLALAHLFDEAVGLDPDQDMLNEAALLAAGRGAGNVAWVRDRAESLPLGLGRFRLVTVAAAFHWMDRPRVATAVKSMLDPDGAAVQVDAPAYRPDELAVAAEGHILPHPVPPFAEIDALRKAYVGPHRRAGKGLRDTSPGNEDEVFRSAGFLPAQTLVVPDQRVLEEGVDDLVAWTLSSSGSAPHLFGPRLPEFEKDLRSTLLRASPAGKFSILLPDNILRIWRLPQPAAPSS